MKIIDVVSVTFDRSRLARQLSRISAERLHARRCRARSQELQPVDQWQSCEQEQVEHWLHRARCCGSTCRSAGVLFFHLCRVRDIDFEKIAVLDENKIEFTVNGERYEWSSGASILPNGGTWNLWVLHDTDYTPLFGSETPVPKAAKKSPNVFEKIEGALTRRAQSSRSAVPDLAHRQTNAVDVPQRVMVGGADTMENLLPKSP